MLLDAACKHTVVSVMDTHTHTPAGRCWRGPLWSAASSPGPGWRRPWSLGCRSRRRCAASCPPGFSLGTLCCKERETCYCRGTRLRDTHTLTHTLSEWLPLKGLSLSLASTHPPLSGHGEPQHSTMCLLISQSCGRNARPRGGVTEGLMKNDWQGV